jgi:hypothetical protein
MGCRCNPLRLIYQGEAPDIKQKATPDRLISPCGDIDSIMRATKIFLKKNGGDFDIGYTHLCREYYYHVGF